MPIRRFLFCHNTRIGKFYIAETQGWFEPIFDDEPLGSYASPEQAAADLAGGHTSSLADSIDTATLGIPEDLREWEAIASR